MRWSLLVLAASLFAAACSSDEGSGPPSGGTGGNGGSAGAPLHDGDLPDDFAPEPGLCRPLCCTDSDCSAGTCVAFDSASGTLGACSSGWAGSEGGLPDAGASGNFTPSCWTANQPACNPLTNESCGASTACDVGGLGDPATKPVIECFSGDNIQGPGEECDNVLGPYCVPGFHCVPN